MGMTAILSVAANVVPFPPVVTDQITQSELAIVATLRSRMRALEAQVEAAETDIRTRLDAGCEVESGERSVELKANSRRSVAWREVAERLAVRAFGKKRGELYCPRVLAATAPSITYSLKIS
jgi:hypothetical protein